MTPNPNIARNALRPATALFLAAVAIPSTAFAQDIVTPPVVVVPAAPAPAPAPVAQAPSGESRTTIAPGVAEQAQQEARERAATQRAERPAARNAPVAQRAPVRPAPAQAVPAVQPAALVAAAPVTPPVETAPATAAPVETTTVETPAEQPAGDGGTLWLVLAGLGVAAAAIAAFLLLRRRREDEVYEDYYEAAPVAAAPVAETVPFVESRAPIAPEPIAAAPMFIDRPAAPPQHEPEVHAALENATLSRPDADDIDAVLGGAAPHGDRPQLELAMRPIRAGLNRDEGVVEFELTVANAGGVQAEDVRIGAFMLSGRPGETAAIEKLLIDPPADGVVEADAIAPGDGTRVDGAVTLPRDDLHVANDGEGHEGFTPVVLADARYRLPDGSEGRTAAAFTIGRVNGGEALVPIAFEDEPAMYADIEARLHSVPAKV
ncbi:LPXTG cell wall anchor domain-containing protein [Sphingomonas sp. MG17]|uniref:LPXTG cell wall anchor domain-containing protein n=1 Tax=Sphingomonas tagetis TaxID=2949092 RepID=A0A9X2HRX2_9SPHN|nr:LPXTG cell wall anchor domain-containing protein [Sphingomonas tagetis]MCP3730770.1 LPXTG cell wall anchor domain-containing protein [Sphingomonas tagetis]